METGLAGIRVNGWHLSKTPWMQTKNGASMDTRAQNTTMSSQSDYKLSGWKDKAIATVHTHTHTHTHTMLILHQLVLCLTPSSSVLAGLLSLFSSMSLRSVCRLEITSLKLALTSLSVSWNPASSSETEGVARGSLLSARRVRKTKV